MAALQKVREGGETANKSKGEGERAMNEAAQEFGHLPGFQHSGIHAVYRAGLDQPARL